MNEYVNCLPKIYSEICKYDAFYVPKLLNNSIYLSVRLDELFCYYLIYVTEIHFPDSFDQ